VATELGVGVELAVVEPLVPGGVVREQRVLDGVPLNFPGRVLVEHCAANYQGRSKVGQSGSKIGVSNGAGDD